MLETQVKICGITSSKDAKLSQSLGADYIGLIFADSSRRVTPDVASDIRRSVPDALLVGVFRDESIEIVIDIAKRCGLNMIRRNKRWWSPMVTPSGSLTQNRIRAPRLIRCTARRSRSYWRIMSI